MGTTRSVKLNVTKRFIFTLRDGREIVLEQDEAEQVRDYLNEELPKAAPVSVESYEDIVSGLEAAVIQKPVPIGFTELFRRKSEPLNGAPAHTYVYYKDVAGNYGFQVENDVRRPFIRLGKITEPESLVGRLAKAFPSEPVEKRWFRTQKIQTNNQTIKALFDILEFEKLIKRRPDFADQRKEIKYVRTEKWVELFGNNHGQVLKPDMVLHPQ